MNEISNTFSANQLIGTLSMCCSFCFLIEGIENAVKTKTNFIYKVTHIGYPAFITWSLFYFFWQ